MDYRVPVSYTCKSSLLVPRCMPQIKWQKSHVFFMLVFDVNVA